MVLHSLVLIRHLYRRHQSASRFENLKRPGEGLAADGIQNNVDVLHAILKPNYLGINDAVGAERTHIIHIVGEHKR